MIEFIKILFSLNILIFIISINAIVLIIRNIFESLFPSLKTKYKKFWGRFILTTLPTIISCVFVMFGISLPPEGIHKVLYILMTGILSNLVFDVVKKQIAKIKKADL